MTEVEQTPLLGGRYRLASWLSRVGAQLIDGIIIGAVALVLFLPLGAAFSVGFADDSDATDRRKALLAATRSITAMWTDPRRAWQALRRVQAPTLVLGGTHDALVPARVLRAVLGDHGGGWRPPADAQPSVDTAYLLFAVGLLAQDRPGVARRVADQVLLRPAAAPGS